MADPRFWSPVLIEQGVIFLDGHRLDLFVSHFADATGGSRFALGDWLVAVDLAQDRLAECRLAALELAFELRFLELDPFVRQELEIFSDPCGLTFSLPECATSDRALDLFGQLRLEEYDTVHEAAIGSGTLLLSSRLALLELALGELAQRVQIVVLRGFALLLLDRVLLPLP